MFVFFSNSFFVFFVYKKFSKNSKFVMKKFVCGGMIVSCERRQGGKRLNKFFNNRKLLFFVVTMVVFIALAVLSTFNGGQNTILSTGNESISLVNRIFGKPVEWVNGLGESISRLFSTYEENKVLKSHIDHLFELQSKNETLEKENEQLKKALELKGNLSDYTTVVSAVIARTPDMWNEQLIIDKGTDAQLQVGMLVMGNNGLIGRIISVNATSAKVGLLTSVQSTNISVSAMIQIGDKTEYGVINKYDSKSKMYVMSNVRLDADIKEGQNVMTSGMNGVGPSSLAIGKVSSVAVDNTGLFKEVMVTPTSDHYDIKYVTVIKRGSESVSQ
ncbi:rod shape-determining protein MreC [Granulicatella sp. zg-84]|nr:rod shape-determining protein MreC [Granulicatella sp. zg-84]